MIFIIYFSAISSCNVKESYNRIEKAYEIPTPKPTTANANPNYINKNFTNNVPNQQIPAGTNNINQISGCRFTDITENKNYFIRVTGEVFIYDNIFENTAFFSGRPGIIWGDYNQGTLIISQCKFSKISGRNSNGNILTCNSLTKMNIIISICEFIDCSEKSSTRPLFNFEGSGGSIKFIHSKFIFNDLTISCQIIDVYTSNVLFDECEFERSGTNSINLKLPNANSNSKEEFEFVNNRVKMNKGQFIKSTFVIENIHIEGNIFENSELLNEHYISISYNSESIEMKNNTFSQITLNTNSESSGCLIIEITKISQGQFNLTYSNCKFIDIKNLNINSPYHYGGAIRYGFSTIDFNIDTNITIIDCEFHRNQVNKHGGALALQTSKTIIIQNCIFESNSVTTIGTPKSRLTLLYDYYSEKKIQKLWWRHLSQSNIQH